MKYALVCLLHEGQLETTGHFVMPFDTEQAAIDFAVARLVKFGEVSRDIDGTLWSSDRQERYESPDKALEAWQEECLGSSEYFHVKAIVMPPHQRYLRHMRLHPESSFAEASIEARIGFMAEVLESPAVPWFVCPACSGHYFGSTSEKVDGRIIVTERQCHDELGVVCRWRGAAT